MKSVDVEVEVGGLDVTAHTAPAPPTPAAEPEAAGSDATLVRDCLAGDEDAWAALIDRYKRLIYSIPVKYGFSTEEATDIFQETCLELLAELPRLREPKALPKWLMQVTSRKCGRARERARAQAPAAASQDDVLLVPDARPDTEDVLLEVEREQALRAAVASMPLRCRQLVEMLFFEHPPRPYAEIARRLDLACGSIGFIRGRCLARLRTELRKNGFQ